MKKKQSKNKAKSIIPKFKAGGILNTAKHDFMQNTFNSDQRDTIKKGIKGTGEFLANYGRAFADYSMGVVGLGNVIQDSDYTGTGSKMFKGISQVGNVVGKAALPMAANAVAPGSGAAISTGQQAIGQFNPESTNQDPNQQKNMVKGQQVADASMQTMQMMQMLNQQNQDYENPDSGVGMGQQNPMRNGGMFYPQGGMINTMPTGGDSNAQIEKQENFITPQDQFGQADGPSHEQGGVDVNIPQGTRIFSDKIKPIGMKATYAILNKKNNTNKEDKILRDNAHAPETKKTAQFMKTVKSLASDNLFEAQEEQKQARVDKYIKRMGGVQKYPGGGFSGDPNYKAWSDKLGINGYQGLSDQPGMMYNPANYKYEYYQPNTNYIPKPFVQPIPGNTPMNISPNGYFEGNTKVANFKFPDGGRFNDGREYSYKEDGIPYQGGNNNWQNGVIGGINAYQQSTPFYDPTLTDAYNQPVNKQIAPLESNRNVDLSQFAGRTTGSNMPYNTKQPVSFNPNWKDAAYFGATSLAQSAGPLAYLADKKNREYDRVNYGDTQFNKADPRASLYEARKQANAVNNSLVNNTSSGNYMANRVAAGANNADEIFKIQSQYDNMNSQGQNQMNQFNKQNQIAAMRDEAANKGAMQSAKYNQIDQLGRNTASGMVNAKADKYDKEKWSYLQYMYNNPEFNRINAGKPGMGKPKFDPYTGKPLK